MALTQDQEAYRRMHHFRVAYERATGARVFVDDLTFDPKRHEELDAAEPKASKAKPTAAKP